jgi:hypothetical protein
VTSAGERRRAVRRFLLVGPALAVVAVAGFLLGACGGGDGSAVTTRTGATATRPTVTAERPTVTVTPTRTEPAAPPPAGTSPATTADQPGETETQPTETPPPAPPPPPGPTVTVIETETTAPEPPPPATTAAEPPPPATTAAEPPPPTTVAAPATDPSETDDTPWGWIVLAVALAGGSLVGLLLWRRQRARADSWSTGLEDLSRRVLVALDAVLAEGSLVTGQVEALAAEARSRETSAPDEASRAAAGALRGRLDDLASALEADRALRLGSPPPSPEQLSYSTALIRRQADQVQDVLRPPPTDPPRV